MSQLMRKQAKLINPPLVAADMVAMVARITRDPTNLLEFIKPVTKNQLSIFGKKK
jgi:hypothetical protein